MAITAAQRQAALTYIIAAAVREGGAASPVPLATLLPGTTPGQVLSVIASALGTSQDANFTTALNNVVTNLNVQLTNVQSNVSAIQAQITANTVV